MGPPTDPGPSGSADFKWSVCPWLEHHKIILIVKLKLFEGFLY
ncbi:unnamed protein product [Staurois parvus]|uniref:Uncharacterized protein n=1 Tax=Staurois parvus TaxID=386267 RepID=A0ABN9C8I3_9NEOB|nr:unnamed protein product [Staurois parvus]